ncbi:MAG: ATP-binding protein, partial [Deltaproteobacteria bacterium]|nr:ATP-binding protein [Deltaproteobacteria bacterium]
MNYRPTAFLFIIIGCLASIFIFYPVHDFMSYVEYVNGLQAESYNFDTSFSYVLHKFIKTMQGSRPLGTLLLGIVGIIIGLCFYFVLQRFNTKQKIIENLQSEIGRDITAIIARGESSHLEFKSSFRWDLKQNAVNKGLEHAVLKTLAAFMNTEGGSLLIGI